MLRHHVIVVALHHYCIFDEALLDGGAVVATYVQHLMLLVRVLLPRDIACRLYSRLRMRLLLLLLLRLMLSRGHIFY